jgi:UDP-N-acetylmuramoylalanine--D-glutamate ligase
MAQALYSDFRDKRVLVAGAGVTGIACADSLRRKGALVTIVDEKEVALVGFEVVTPAAITMSDFEFLLVSPGWRDDHPLITRAREAGLALINEIDFAWSLKSPSQKWIALTGTNGKTSTVELTAQMLSASGASAIACGNVGTTVIESVESSEKYDFLVLELSSFQLHWMEDPSFVAVAVLNIAEDHVDWHGTFDAYAKDKLTILDKSSTAILNGDDGEIVTRTSHWQGNKIFFSLDTPAPGQIGVVEELLVDRAFVADPQEAAMLSELNEVKPTVPHNVSNALAAAGLARTVGVSHDAIRQAIAAFTPGKHRIEKILEKDGVSWINDSKATNPHAAAASIMSGLSVIWVAGGLAKGATMGDLVERVKARVKVAILIGTDQELIAREIRTRAPHIEIISIATPSQYVKGATNNSLMEEVVRTAHKHATSGDTVLLAPACASMDQFISYSDRGDRFSAAVEKVIRDDN